MKLEYVQGPEKEPVDLEEMKLYLRLEGNTEDSLIESFIISARLYCENYQKQAYYTQTLKVTFSAAEAVPEMELPRSKYLQEVTAVKAVLPDGTEKELLYLIVCGDVYSKVVISDLPADADVTVEYITGKDDVQMEDVKTAVKLLVSAMYNNRLPYDENGKMFAEVPFGVKALLNRGRVL